MKSSISRLSKNFKIHILFEFHDGPYGGGNQFLKNLKNEFIRKKIYEHQIEKADVVLFNSFQNFPLVIYLKLKYPDKIWVHRVDGPISEYRGKDLYVDKIIYEINNKIADGTVFQSTWSQKANRQLGMKTKDHEIVIHNEPDKNIFNTKNKDKYRVNGKIRLVAVSWSSNWNKGFEFYKYLDEKLNFKKYEMTFIGNSPIKFKNIHHLPPLDSRNLAWQLKKHDIYVTASKNDPCSNSAVEALACGLPVIYLKSGGHSEIVGSGGEGFVSKKDLIRNIRLISSQYTKYRIQKNHKENDNASKKYFDFIHKLKLYNQINSTLKTRLNIIIGVISILMIWMKEKRNILINI